MPPHDHFPEAIAIPSQQRHNNVITPFVRRGRTHSASSPELKPYRSASRLQRRNTHNKNTRSFPSASSAPSTTVSQPPSASRAKSTPVTPCLHFAPPVSSVSIKDFKLILTRPASGGYSCWITIQVYPCHVTLPRTNTATTPFSRKPYCIHRQYGDVVRFAQRMEDGLLRLRAASLSSISSAASFFIHGSPEAMVNALAMTLRDRNTPFPRLKTRTLNPRQHHSDVREDIDQYLHELFALGPAVGQCRLVSEFFGIWKSDLDTLNHADDREPVVTTAPQCWPLNSQHNGTQVTMFPASAALSSSPPTVLPQPVPVPKRPSLNAAGGLPFPIEFGMAASPRRANFAFSESPSSSSCNSDESFRVEDSDTDYDELIPVCSSNDHSDVEDNHDYTIFKRNSQPLGPSSNTQSTSKRMPIPIVKNSVALHNITRPNPSFLTQEEDLSSSPSSPSRQHPPERHPRSQLSRNSKSKRFAFVPPPLPPMPHSATSFHNDIDSPTTPTTPCFAEGEAFYSNRSLHSFDSSPNSSTENLATRTQSIIVAKSHRPSSLNPNPRHLSYRHSSNNLNDAKNAADADAKKQTESRSSMVGKSKERMSRTSVSDLTDPNYQKPSTRSRLKAAAALVTPVQIPKTPLETRKSLVSPLSAGPVLMTPRSSSLVNMAATPAPVAVPTTPTLASPPIVNPKLVKKALKTRSRTALPGSMDATEEMRLRSRSMTSLTQVTGTSMDAGLERSKTYMYRTSSSSPSSPATTCPPTFGDVMMKAQLVQRRRPREMQFPVQMRGDPNCTRCHGHGFIREPELPELLDVSLIPSLNQAPIPFRPINHQGSSSGGFVSTFKIIRDAKNIVVLRIDEADHDFTLSVPDLRLRVQKKLVKMDIPLPQEFELIWTPSSGGGSSVVLKNDEELRKAIQASGHHKVTLQCHF